MAILTYNESRVNTRTQNIAGYLLFFASTLMLLVLDFAPSRKGGVGPFVGICFIIGAFGVADAHIQGGMSFFVGLVASGAMTFALRLIIKAAFENVDHGLRKGVRRISFLTALIKTMAEGRQATYYQCALSLFVVV